MVILVSNTIRTDIVVYMQYLVDDRVVSRSMLDSLIAWNTQRGVIRLET